MVNNMGMVMQIIVLFAKLMRLLVRPLLYVVACAGVIALLIVLAATAMGYL